MALTIMTFGPAQHRSTVSRPGRLRARLINTRMMYVRYPPSLRNVEDLLAERGIDISHETVRFWWNRFGPIWVSPSLPLRDVVRLPGGHHSTPGRWT
jgi:hypothetical protein